VSHGLSAFPGTTMGYSFEENIALNAQVAVTPLHTRQAFLL
jgi:hypothetical protein